MPEQPTLYLDTCIQELIAIQYFPENAQLAAAQESVLANVPGLVREEDFDLLKTALTEVFVALVAQYDYGETDTLTPESIEGVLASVGVDTAVIRQRLSDQLGATV